MTEDAPNTLENIAESLGSIAASLTEVVSALEHLRTFGMPTQR